MTIVLALKVGDGVVLGADSASTIMGQNHSYHNSYFNAEKLFNLVKGLPIGAVTYGLGGLANRSVGSLAKDLRVRLAKPSDKDWYLNPAAYTMADVADSMKRFFFDEIYSREIKPSLDAPGMGFLIAGYSAGATSAEVWQFSVKDGGLPDAPIAVVPESEPWGAQWEGQGEAIRRLLMGYSWELVNRLVAAGMPQKDALQLVQSVQPVVHPTMPIQDAIDLVHFLIETTCGYVRFAPGPATVAQPIDSAAITRHEGFRWVRRKHYYLQALNIPAKNPE
ncbi:MAG: hypothetical protein ACYC2K_14940 [Gemmatimonadales bacterium]